METEKFVESLELSTEQRSVIEVESREIEREVSGLKVGNRNEYEKAVSLGARNSRILKGLELLRKGIVQPYREKIDQIDRAFDKLKEVFQDADSKIRRALGLYQEKVKTEAIKTVQVTEGGRATVQKRMSFEVTDPALVPHEWCKPDENKIGRAVRGRLVTEIPGVKIWEENVTSFVTG